MPAAGEPRFKPLTAPTRSKPDRESLSVPRFASAQPIPLGLSSAAACRAGYFTALLYNYISAKRTEYDILKVLAQARSELAAMIGGYIEVLGGAGKAS